MLEFLLQILQVIVVHLQILGKVSNKGIELLVKVKPIVTDDFAMELSLNYTNNDSEVVATNDTDGMVSLDEPRGVAGNRNMRVMHIVGERYGALFGTSFKRDDKWTHNSRKQCWISSTCY